MWFFKKKKSESDVSQSVTDERKYCPCCGYRVMAMTENALCPVCGWVDDIYQLYNPAKVKDYNNNRVFLLQAQTNFEAFGTCEKDKTGFTRTPSAEEKRNPNWKIKQNITFNFRQEILNYILGNNSEKDLPRIAVMGLELGLESDALGILAGMSDERDTVWELEQYFNRAVKELNYDMPDVECAAIELARHYADLIISRELDPVIGTELIINKCFAECNFMLMCEKYVLDGIAFETAYGYLVTISELADAYAPWDKVKPNTQLMLEEKERLIEELKKWRSKDTAEFPQMKKNE